MGLLIFSLTTIFLLLVVFVHYLWVLFRPEGNKEVAQDEAAPKGRIWITSDLHWGHNKEFLWGPRGFDSVWDMMVWTCAVWNKMINDNDDVYILGDLMLNDDEVVHQLFQELKGRIHVVLGNHDTQRRIDLYEGFSNVVEVVEAKRLRYGKYHFYLTHYPTLVGNFDDGDKLTQKTINLCGHSHTSDPFADWNKGTIYHCELDAHNNQPILLDDIIADLQQKIKNGS